MPKGVHPFPHASSLASAAALESPRPLRRALDASQDLKATFGDQLLPRLLLAQSWPLLELDTVGASGEPPSAPEIEALADVAARGDTAEALRIVRSTIARSATREMVLLLLIAPAARLLGDQWCFDERSFADVMDGLRVLQDVARGLGSSELDRVDERS